MNLLCPSICLSLSCDLNFGFKSKEYGAICSVIFVHILWLLYIFFQSEWFFIKSFRLSVQMAAKKVKHHVYAQHLTLFPCWFWFLFVLPAKKVLKDKTYWSYCLLSIVALSKMYPIRMLNQVHVYTVFWLVSFGVWIWNSYFSVLWT